MITERILRDDPSLVKVFTGLPAGEFWQLIEDLAARFEEERLADGRCIILWLIPPGRAFLPLCH
jgi:hypothetical protein